MSEADTPNYENMQASLPDDNSPHATPENASDSVAITENENKILLSLPASSPEAEQLDEASGEYWIEVLDNGLATISAVELAQMFELIQELRCANTQLLDRVDELTQSFVESQKVLQTQQKRTQVHESVINQQNQDLAIAQEQVEYLFHELQASHQTAQRQQIVIETYKTQLESTQERVAQLERECALVQTNYNEQTHQILQSENTCRELRSRLIRQQRQTLQYKSALEKCLEMSVPSSEVLADTKAPGQPQCDIPSQPFFRKGQPIRPWSAEPAFSNSDDDAGVEPTANEFLPADAQAGVESEITTESTPVSTATSASSLEEQLDAVIQMFFHAHPATDIPDTTQPTAPDIQPDWEDEQPIGTTTAVATDTAAVEVEPALPETPPTPSNPLNTNTNWPSPLVNPLRPPKGRKSLASIELPTFRQQENPKLIDS